MYPSIHVKKAALLLVVPLVCFGLLLEAQAVVPPPDGGYPNFNTAEGQKALFSLTTGVGNTAVGALSLLSNTEGSFNTATGAGTLLFNTADQNTAFGGAALLLNATGRDNTAVGAAALLNNTEGDFNTALGDVALHNNTTGGFNTAIGVNALLANISGSGNTALGSMALAVNSTGNSNTAVGAGALNRGGDFNTALGVYAGYEITGANNIDIGYLVIGVAGESNTIRIGNTDITDTYISGISGTTVASGAAVLVDSSGHLGTVTSSRRFKEEVRPMNKTSEAIFSLEPVTFRYKKGIDRQGIPQFGLVAEDVEKVNPDLVVRDKEGKPYTVRYDQVNTMLLNEFLKEHTTVQEQRAMITRQQKQIEALTEGLQKVSAQLEASQPAPQMVNNP